MQGCITRSTLPCMYDVRSRHGVLLSAADAPSDMSQYDGGGGGNGRYTAGWDDERKKRERDF